MSDHQFKLQINFTKSYVDQDGNHCLEGVASGPEVDLTDERMSPEALKSMVSSIKRRLIEFRDAHKQEWNDDLGEVVELSLDESNHLIYRSVLDMNLSGSKDLWYRVHTLGKKYGVSIGGAVLKAGMEYVADLGRQVYTYFDVDLYEISITRQAAYQYSFANAVLKSLPMKEEPMQKNQENQDEQSETQTSTTGGESVTTSTNDIQPEETVAAEDQSDATETQEQTEAEEVESDVADNDAAADEADAEIEGAEETDQDKADSMEEVAEAAESGNSESEPTDEVSKALTDAQAEAESLRKSLVDANGRVEELTKSFEAKSTEAEAAHTELAEVKKSLAEKETELEKINTRKGMVFDKFTGHEASKDTQEEVVKASNEQFASFIITGAR